jgi:hypothetical protein
MVSSERLRTSYRVLYYFHPCTESLYSLIITFTFTFNFESSIAEVAGNNDFFKGLFPSS